MTDSVQRSWQRITTWLEKNAARSFQGVAPPSDPDLRAALNAVPVELPPDLLEWWRLTNGTSVPTGSGELLPPHFEPMSVESSLRLRRRLLDGGSPIAREAAERDAAGSHAGAFLSVFVPVAADGAGDCLFVDLRDGPDHGCVKHWSGDEGSLTPPWWASVRDMLADVADAMDQGREALRERTARANRQFLSASTYKTSVHDGGLAWTAVTTQP